MGGAETGFRPEPDGAERIFVYQSVFLSVWSDSSHDTPSKQ